MNTGKDVVNEVYKDARSVVTTVGDIGKGVVDSGKGLVDGVAGLFDGLGDLLNPNTIILIIGGVVVISLINKSGK